MIHSLYEMKVSRNEWTVPKSLCLLLPHLSVELVRCGWKHTILCKELAQRALISGAGPLLFGTLAVPHLNTMLQGFCKVSGILTMKEVILVNSCNFLGLIHGIAWHGFHFPRDTEKAQALLSEHNLLQCHTLTEKICDEQAFNFVLPHF